MGKLLAICTSPKRGTVKTEVPSAVLTPEWGIVEDAHGGNWHRQVSMLSAEKIEAFRKKIWVDYGAFGENLVIEGFDFRNLPVTSRFAIGDVVLEMTQIGKECHNDCVIKQQTGECIMPHEGVFARVLTGGEIHVGDEVTLLPALENPPLRAAVITLSDKGSRGERDDNGVFNFEGGCYAKVINLDKDSEPDIYNAIKRNALLENVTLDAEGKIDFADKSVTENTRVSYPINHIQNIVRPISSAPAAKNVIFLSADAFGVLPPVSVLTPEQTQYYFLSGFTAKLAGTERGITEPTPTFSACFGQAFLELHPTKYAQELVKKMEMSGAKAYLVNTGWNGTGKRISIKDTRGIIDAILSGAILTAPTKKIPYFNFEVPTELPGVDPAILDPRDTYADASAWEEKAKDLAARFIKNFAKYEGNESGKALVAAGPQL